MMGQHKFFWSQDLRKILFKIFKTFSSLYNFLIFSFRVSDRVSLILSFVFLWVVVAEVAVVVVVAVAIGVQL